MTAGGRGGLGQGKLWSTGVLMACSDDTRRAFGALDEWTICNISIVINQGCKFSDFWADLRLE